MKRITSGAVALAIGVTLTLRRERVGPGDR